MHLEDNKNRKLQKRPCDAIIVVCGQWNTIQTGIDKAVYLFRLDTIGAKCQSKTTKKALFLTSPNK